MNSDTGGRGNSALQTKENNDRSRQKPQYNMCLNDTVNEISLECGLCF